MSKDLLESVQEQIRQNKENYKPVFSKQNKILTLCELVCIVSFLVSVVSLVGYAIVI
jgi:cell division protein FtsL